MQPIGKDIAGMDWATELGLSREEIARLNPCVPGEFTLSNTYYLNSASPGIVYVGTAEGSLPLVSGSWYLIPESIVDRHAGLKNGAAPVARAARLAR